MSPLRLADSPTEPEIHRRRREEQRGKGWVPRAVKNIARHHEQIFAQRPRANAPVERHHKNEEDNESERVEKHGCCGSPAVLAKDLERARNFSIAAGKAINRQDWLFCEDGR